MDGVSYKTELDVRFHVRGCGTGRYEHRRWELIAPFVVVDGAKEWTVPVGFWTDFASVPKVLWNILSPFELGYGPILHDFGYYAGLGQTREYWDKLFWRCMVHDEITAWKTERAYDAVRLLAGPVWDGYRQQGSQEFQLNRITARLSGETEAVA